LEVQDVALQLGGCGSSSVVFLGGSRATFFRWWWRRRWWWLARRFLRRRLGRRFSQFFLLQFQFFQSLGRQPWFRQRRRAQLGIFWF